MNTYFKYINSELNEGLAGVPEEQFDNVCKILASTNRPIFGLGAGRMGYSIRAFIMRLSHLGYPAFMIGDTNLPRIQRGDLVFINSSSGETPSIKLFAEQAKREGAKIVLVTAKNDSSIAKIADTSIYYKSIKSKQLMKTYHEQLTWLIFDAISMKVFDLKDLDRGWVENNHSILE
jgi:6-phospho-3-hexuloisomerase